MAIEQEEAMANRRYDIDWLRLIVMMLVFLFHCGRFFGGGRWHLTNSETSIVAHLFIGVLDLWFMPFFFLLSGFGTWYSLRSRSAGQYAKERAKRILVPLYTMGLLFLLPPQYYFEMLTNRGYEGGFWELMPNYFGRLIHFNLDWPGSLLPLPFSGHLWFLQFLFLISILSLPILSLLQSEGGRTAISALARVSERWGGVLLFILPLAVIRVGLRSFLGGEHSWAGLVEFLFFFVVGFVFASDSRFFRGIAKCGWLGVLLGLGSFAIEGYFILGLGYNYPGREDFSLKFLLFETCMSIGRWSWILFMLWVGNKWLNFSNRFLTYGNEAVLPFYILHQTVILCVGWFVIAWDIAILPKFIIIVAISFATILALYDLPIRRFGFMRFLFGMAPKR